MSVWSFHKATPSTTATSELGHCLWIFPRDPRNGTIRISMAMGSKRFWHICYGNFPSRGGSTVGWFHVFSDPQSPKTDQCTRNLVHSPRYFVIQLLKLPHRNVWDRQQPAAIYHLNAESSSCVGKARTGDTLSWLQSSHCSNCWHSEMSKRGAKCGHISYEHLQLISVWSFYFENYAFLSRLQSTW